MPSVMCRLLRESAMTYDRFDRILIHQATLPYLDEMLDVTGIPADRVELTVATLGNMAASSLPGRQRRRPPWMPHPSMSAAGW